jgi:hypothetical protein
VSELPVFRLLYGGRTMRRDKPFFCVLDRLYHGGRIRPAMVINAVVISHSDPGAVPGASTTLCCALRLPPGSRPQGGAVSRGRNRIDEGVKDLAFARHDTAVIGSFRIVANDNYAEAALAA